MGELWEQANVDFQTGLKLDFDDETENESKVAAEKAKTIRDAAVKERVQKEQQEYDKKLAEDRKAYEAAVKAREAEWTDAKEQKYQETCRKAEQEKKRKESAAAAAKEAAEAKAAEAASPKKEEGPRTAEAPPANDPQVASSTAEEPVTNQPPAESTEESGGYASTADAPAA